MSTPALSTAVVLRVEDGSCEVSGPAGAQTARFAPQFPTPHRERVSPGNLVALAPGDDGRAVVLWRWFDVVVIGFADDGRIAVWEPAHGEVTATARSTFTARDPGSRAYASAGLPGADWWVAAAVPPSIGSAAVPVDLDEVAALYDAHDLWTTALAAPE
ncbi:hypothetical protein ABLG96_03945 [Nakamurella sp. A5-74]|uniref:Uncharacterized protein n=1 Tax=Nakamurella sp. A5-74 TaxID=3158264 RepID=A0AAU8DQD5_9ACTN